MNQELLNLLEEARPHLRRAFPGIKELTLREQDAEGETILKVTVHLSPHFPDPEAALRAFDEAWWLENCHRSHGLLVFDYEVGGWG